MNSVEPSERIYRLMALGSDKPIVVLQSIFSFGRWIVYFEHEAGKIATYDGAAETPELALELFIRHRIEGEPQPDFIPRAIW